MTARHAMLVLLCVLLLAVAALTACGRTGAGPAVDLSGGQPAAGRPAATQSGTPDATATSSTVDVRAIENQLDAMQRELDGMSMPSDSDFKGAEGSVY